MKKITLLLLSLAFSAATYAQHRNCGTMEHLDHQQSNDPNIKQRMDDIESYTSQKLLGNKSAKVATEIITIPVVVHVLYKYSTFNISDEQIQSQIDVLNEDFRRTNADADNKWPVAADTQIQFALATVDPNGEETTGITRTTTSTYYWDHDDAMKKSSEGGVDPWDTSAYLNIWVCNLEMGLLGYAQFPGGDPETDGVVVTTRSFGSSDKGSFTLSTNFGKGRTTTHEIGHFLNLRHVWGDNGDDSCSYDDYVSDTPNAEAPNTGCNIGNVSCGSEDMAENYMDYTNDACMNLFTQGQKDRMRAVLEAGGARRSLALSDKWGDDDYVSIPALIEAEDYITEEGIQTEDTEDPNGGNLNVGYIHTNDYLTYDINVLASGEYAMNFRVAAKSSTIKFDIYQNGNVVGAIETAATGDYQAWKTVSTTVNLAEGNQTIKLLATDGGWNINWLEFTEADEYSNGYVNIPALIEAEDYITEEGIQTEETEDPNGGGLNVGWIGTNDYLTYDINVTTSGAYTVEFRVAAKGSTIKFDIYEDDNYIGDINETPTGDYQSWKTVSATVNLTKGNQTIKLLATGGGWNINWLEFASEEEDTYCNSGTNLAAGGFIASYTSQQNSDNGAANLIDGNDSNRWSAEGFPQSVVVDLGDSYNVNKINLITHDNRDYHFKVEGSVASASSGFSTLVNGSGTTTSSFSTEKVRYVKLTITGATNYGGNWISIKEFEVLCAGESNSRIAATDEVFEITTFPNPFTEIITVRSLNDTKEIGSVQLIDLAGKTVANQVATGNNVVISNLNRIGQGFYLLQVLDKQNQLIEVKKLVKN